MWHEGSHVAYVGPASGEWPIGLIGTVMADAGGGAHVMWPGGRGITLIASTEIVAWTGNDGLDDSLDVGSMQVQGVRAVAEAEGVTGVLNRMADYGHLSCFPEIADEAYRLIEGRIRSDAAIRAVADQLEPEDAEALFSTASMALLRDAFLDGPED